MNEKIKKYLSLYNRANSGDKLSQAEWKFFIEFSHQPDPETVAELQKTKPFEGKTVDETLAMMQDSLVGTLSAPENKKAVLELSEKAEQGKLSDKIGAALNIALVGTDIATSLGQIKAADRQLQKTTRPTKPSPLTEDPLLQQALSDAQRGNYDSVRALAPAQLAILDSYLGDLNNAEVASGGQAGTYGALAQVAATRRGKRSLELAPIVDNIQRENLQRYDQLLGHKLSENQAIQQSQAQFYPQDLYQYGLDQQAAGQLGAQGRSNLRSSIGAGANFLPQLASDIATRRKYKGIYDQMKTLAPEYADMAVGAHANITDPNSNYMYTPSPQFLNQVEQAYI